MQVCLMVEWTVFFPPFGSRRVSPRPDGGCGCALPMRTTRRGYIYCRWAASSDEHVVSFARGYDDVCVMQAPAGFRRPTLNLEAGAGGGRCASPCVQGLPGCGEEDDVNLQTDDVSEESREPPAVHTQTHEGGEMAREKSRFAEVPQQQPASSPSVTPLHRMTPCSFSRVVLLPGALVLRVPRKWPGDVVPGHPRRGGAGCCCGRYAGCSATPRVTGSNGPVVRSRR